jgi:thioredoxin-like negative regulator of GroEL
MIRKERRLFVKNFRTWVCTLVIGVWMGLGGTPSPAVASSSVMEGYKAALRKGAMDGKPILIDFYTTWCPHCKEQAAVMKQVAAELDKFVVYKVNADRNQAFAKQFGARGYPTVVIVRPDGTDAYRWTGAYQNATDLTEALEAGLAKVGPLEKKTPVAGATNTAVSALSPEEKMAAAEIKTAENYAKMGRPSEAVKILNKILEKYPDTQAAMAAQDKLDEIGGKN